MPNYVTTRINAPKLIISAMLNAEGKVDLSVIAPQSAWKTKWNVSEQELGEESARFETPWSWPEGALKTLSQRFPEDEMEVLYSDEYLGGDCGRLVLKGGKCIEKDVAPSWEGMNEGQKEVWKAFFHQVTSHKLDA